MAAIFASSCSGEPGAGVGGKSGALPAGELPSLAAALPDDTDEENGAMQFLPGSHKVGHIPWKESSEESVLNQQIKDISMFDKPFSNNLKAGEYSLHSSLLVHGSPKNQSLRRRCGLTIRYAPQDVVPLSPNYSEMSYFVSGDITAPHWQDNLPPSKYFL